VDLCALHCHWHYPQQPNGPWCSTQTTIQLSGREPEEYQGSHDHGEMIDDCLTYRVNKTSLCLLRSVRGSVPVSLRRGVCVVHEPQREWHVSGVVCVCVCVCRTGGAERAAAVKYPGVSQTLPARRS